MPVIKSTQGTPIIRKRMALSLAFASLFIFTICQAQVTSESDDQSSPAQDIGDTFFSLLISDDQTEIDQSLTLIKENWSENLVPITLETLGYAQSEKVRDQLLALIEATVPKSTFPDNNKIFQWAWNQNLTAPVGYSNFKAELYSNIDRKFYNYFHNRQDSARIRLDEIRWGGVVQDGIPPLRNPDMISANDADYLGDDNIVFGIEINGDVRAYPKRILAWHEMFTDTIGGVDIAGVYCTLCGTVIPYKTEHKGTKYNLGTSGFLYRSNKLMYDKATQSMWSTTEGKPVLGPLVDQGIQLEYESVVTTTWGEWKRRHPQTTVLSLNTGHQRDYGEGVAYSDYFNTDRLMFNTPFNDDRLNNKREVLALRFPAAPNQQLAIDTDFLNKNPIYQNKIGPQTFVVLTDKTGANRVYETQGITFEEYDNDQTVIDSNGKQWLLNESSLRNEDGKELGRLPYHRAFWFGWLAAFPETKLIK